MVHCILQIFFGKWLLKFERMVYFCLIFRFVYSKEENSFSRTTEQQQRFHEICSNLVKTRRRAVGWWKRLFTLKEEKPKMVLVWFWLISVEQHFKIVSDFTSSQSEAFLFYSSCSWMFIIVCWFNSSEYINKYLSVSVILKVKFILCI